MLGKIKWQKNAGCELRTGKLVARTPGRKNLTVVVRRPIRFRNLQFLSVCLIRRLGREVQFRQGLWIADL
jgi:hypothetical protein